ncbi:MAG: hypothetical protein ABI596_12610 [Pyrinomonadaceae bacterium]
MNTMNTEFKSENSDWMKTISLIVTLLALVIVMVWLSGCSTPSGQNLSTTANKATASNNPATRPPAKNRAPPKSLADAGEYGENVYDMAKANDWAKASAKLNLLRESATKLTAETPGRSVALDSLTSGIGALDKAVLAKNRPEAMREANQITFNVADLSAAYDLAVPSDITKLDYYGRELEIWSAEKDTNRLQSTAAEMRRTWDAVRPAVESHKGTAEAKKFEELVAKVEKAGTPDEYARLATAVLSEVDNLEKVFHG